MLKLYESFAGTAVLSLRVGRPIAQVLDAIINPNNLFIEGWYVVDNKSGDNLILLSKDVRDVIDKGLVVDDHEVLCEAGDLVRLKDTLKLKFKLGGLKVTSESGKNYGKVSDFAFDIPSFYIQKLYATQPLVRNLSGGTLSIDRSQIIEITNRRVIIEDPTMKSKSRGRVTAPSPAG